MKESETNHKKGIIILSGNLVLESPAIFGAGLNEDTDIDLQKNANGIPFISATSFLGVIRHLFESNPENEKLWGYVKNKTKDKTEDIMQSSITCSDLVLNNDVFQTKIRDGIKIDSSIGTVANESKYNYQTLEQGAFFSMYLKASYDEDRKEITQITLAQICKFLLDGIRVGAKTNNGFGKLRLSMGNLNFKDCNLEDTNQIVQWFIGGSKPLAGKNLNYESILTTGKEDLLKLAKKETPFQIKASFLIDNSFIIRSYSTNPKDPDATHLKSNGKPILSGSSLKGAIRARAEKILRTIGKNPADSIWENFFGTEGNPKEDKPAIKSRLSVTESFFENTTEELQTRIKIDRFTGGTMDGALFDSKPLFQNNGDNASVEFDINIRDFNSNKKEDQSAAGLLLLVLKDIWTGDLPIGGEKNVGRGRLKGVEATITWDEKEVKIKEENQTLKATFTKDNQDAWAELEEFVTALNDLVGKS